MNIELISIIWIVIMLLVTHFCRVCLRKTQREYRALGVQADVTLSVLEFQHDFEEMVIDFLESPEIKDTVWLEGNETLFERMESIYSNHFEASTSFTEKLKELGYDFGE